MTLNSKDNQNKPELKNEGRVLLPGESEKLIPILKVRFTNNKHRHKNADWTRLETKLLSLPDKLWSLHEMERTGGEPDVVSYSPEIDEYVFCDCSAETPSGRRSICYDFESQESRKENKPKNNALSMASEMGIDLLDEEQYRELQTLGPFDTKTSSWIKTPSEIRKLGGALFGDFRFGRTFVYHNTAPSYYNSRAFRGRLLI